MIIDLRLKLHIVLTHFLNSPNKASPYHNQFVCCTITWHAYQPCVVLSKDLQGCVSFGSSFLWLTINSKEVCQEEREAVITNTLTRGHAFVLSTLRDLRCEQSHVWPIPSCSLLYTWHQLCMYVDMYVDLTCAITL
jgi:hypothetical protein